MYVLSLLVDVFIEIEKAGTQPGRRQKKNLFPKTNLISDLLHTSHQNKKLNHQFSSDISSKKSKVKTRKMNALYLGFKQDQEVKWSLSDTVNIPPGENALRD